MGPVPTILRNRAAKGFVLIDSHPSQLVVKVPIPVCKRSDEFHPKPLAEPCVNLSIYTARVIHRELPPSATTSRLLLLPVGQVDHDANDLSPSLHGHYPASLLLRDSPSLPDGSVLSASRGCRLCLFLLHRQTGSQVPYQSPGESHATCTPDTTWPVIRFPPCSFPESGGAPVLMPPVDLFRGLISGSLAFVSLSHT
jgi:hypothetical protein